jgi:putative intracellular protease/amidase
MKKLAEKGKLVAAICFAPQFLARTGFLKIIPTYYLTSEGVSIIKLPVLF